MLVIRATAFALLALTTAAHATDADWHTYYDTAHGFSIAYPDGWTVNPNFADKGYRYTQGDTDDVRTGIGISPAIDLAPGTNLESKSLVIAIQAARPGDTCRASAFLADPPPDYVTQTIQDTPELAHTMAEPGDQYAIEHIVRMVARQPCLALQVYLVYGQTPLRTAHPPRQFDRKALSALIERIAATLKPLK